MKPRKCANPECRTEFTPAFSTTQKVCKWQCGLAIKDANHDKARRAIASQERAEHRQAKEKVKTRSQHMQEAQTAFNAWVRLRDAGQPCISCGTTADVQYCAGHYRTVGSCPELRFEPLNVHLQCNKNCNMEKSGNIVSYRQRLLGKIGCHNLAWLEGPHEPKKYTIEDLKAIKTEYRAKVREMKRATE